MAPDQQVGVAGVLHADLAHHLADDDLDMLIVDIHALLTVDLQDLLDQVVVHAAAPRMRSTSWGFKAPSCSWRPFSITSPSFTSRPVWGTA